jgi:hypothetical protein
MSAGGYDDEYFSAEIYNPPGGLRLRDLTEHLMQTERWGWSKALAEAMARREAAHARKEAERQRRRGGS